MKDYSVHLTELFVGNISVFNTVSFGVKVKAPLKTTTSHGNTIRWQEINLSEMKGGYAYITSTTHALKAMLDSQNIILIDSSEGSSNDRGLNNKSEMSGVVLLAVCYLNKNRKKHGHFWDTKHFDIMKSCKDNIIKGDVKHHQSSGSYYSWGNRGNYRTVDDSSVTQYTFKKGKGLHSELNASFIEELMMRELKNTINQMSNKLPFLSSIIAPVIGVAFKMQAQKGNIKIDKTSASDLGIWQSTLSVNAVTEELHTEDDVTYTVIDVPLQKKSTTDIKYHFLFYINKNINLSLPMNPGTSIVFSGKLLTHRQSCNVYKATEDELFFNFGAYGNKKLYNHIKQSYNCIDTSDNEINNNSIIQYLLPVIALE